MLSPPSWQGAAPEWPFAAASGRSRSGNKARLQKPGRDLQADKHAGTAGYRRLHQRTRTTHRCAADRASATGERLSASNRATASYRCGGPRRARTAANRQANRDWRRRRSLAGAAPDDCRPVALAATRGKAVGPDRIWQPSIFPTALSCLPKPAQSAAHRCMSSLARRACAPSTPEESTSSRAISPRFAPHLRPKTARSRGLLPIRAW